MRSLKSELSQIRKDSDCWYDLVDSGRSKRRRVCRNGNSEPNYIGSAGDSKSGSVKSKEDMVDPEYKMYLDIITGDRDGEDDDAGVSDFDRDGEDDDADPEYKVFLENLKKDGNTFALEMTKGNGTRIFMKYEGAEVDDFSNGGRGPFVVKKKAKFEPSNQDLCNSGPEPMDSRPFLSDCKRKMISQADESYYMFLSNIQIKGRSLIYKTKDCILKYEQGDEMTAESEGLADDSVPSFNEKKFKNNANCKAYNSYMDEDEDDRDSVQSISSFELVSEFEEKLNRELKKPYDQKELDDLLKAAKAKKKMERSRELRSRCLTYPTNRKSLSYLDYHPDLARMIKQALSLHNQHRALFLLRCLFFYLKNLSQKGAFVPWKHPPILEMILGF